MEFWLMAYEHEWVTKDDLKLIVKTKLNPFGEITLEEYQTITSEYFEEGL